MRGKFSRYIIFVNKRTWSESRLIGAANNRHALMNNSVELSRSARHIRSQNRHGFGIGAIFSQ
jgi:hypothetical protein